MAQTLFCLSDYVLFCQFSILDGENLKNGTDKAGPSSVGGEREEMT